MTEGSYPAGKIIPSPSELNIRQFRWKIFVASYIVLIPV